MVPALLIYGAQDKFVTLEEEQWMQEVSKITELTRACHRISFSL